jgi:hypothetical protein
MAEWWLHVNEKVEAHTADDLKKWLDHECTGLGFMIAGSDHVIRKHQVSELEGKLLKLETLLDRMALEYKGEDRLRDIRVMRGQAATLRAFVLLVLAPIADLTWTSTTHLDKPVGEPVDLAPVEGRMREGGGWKGGAQYHRGGHAHGDGHVHHAGSMKHGTMHTDGMKGTQTHGSHMRDSHGKFK